MYTNTPPFQGLKCNWTNINQIKRFLFNICFENNLQAMISLSLELMDITRDGVFFFVMLCHFWGWIGFVFEA